MTSFFKNTFSGPIEDLVNWFKQYTVEPKQETTENAQEGGEVTIPVDQIPTQSEGEIPVTP